jgi:antirestriction protein ArdC
MSAIRQDVYSRVTSRIVDDLEKGVRSWVKPWSVEHAAARITRPLRHNGTPYQGINVLLLWGECVMKGYAAPIWMTYRQAAALNAHVRKGENGSLVVYADRIKRTAQDADGEAVACDIPFMKAYTVFNVEQIEGLPDRYYSTPATPLPLSARTGGADAFVAATGAAIRHGGTMAFYGPRPDHIQLPPIEAFRDAESYYATALHELTHNAARRIMPRRMLRDSEHNIFRRGRSA